jgi:predicted CopG family antitoxin
MRKAPVTVMLEPEKLQKLQALAKKENKSVSELIREVVEETYFKVQ